MTVPIRGGSSFSTRPPDRKPLVIVMSYFLLSNTYIYIYIYMCVFSRAGFVFISRFTWWLLRHNAPDDPRTFQRLLANASANAQTTNQC